MTQRHRPRMLWSWPEAYADDEELRELLDGFAEVEVGLLPQAQLEMPSRTWQILVPHLRHEVEPAVFNACPQLALIATPSTGSDHIDHADARGRGIDVLTLKEERELLDRVQATAEHAWLLLLACARRLPKALRQTGEGQWDAQSIRGEELIGRTLGIVGYGRLGSMVSRFAQAFRMQVIACDPQVQITDPWVRQVSFNELLTRSDFVTIHVHLDESTHHLFGRESFAQLKRGAILINTSRGGLVDEAALIAALDEGTLSAAGLDVIDGERDPGLAHRPLLTYARSHPNLIVTPHIGGCTAGSQRKVFLHFARMLESRWRSLCASRGEHFDAV